MRQILRYPGVSAIQTQVKEIEDRRQHHFYQDGTPLLTSYDDAK